MKLLTPKDKNFNYYRQTIKNISWNFLFLLLSGPIAYSVRILYAREIPKVHVGLFYALLDFFSLLYIFTNLGLKDSLLKFIPKFSAQNRVDLIKSTIVSVILIELLVSIATSVLVITFSPLIIRFYLLKNTSFLTNLFKVKLVLLILTLSFAIQNVVDVVLFAIRGFQVQRYVTTIPFVKMSLILIFSAIFIYFEKLRNALAPSLAYTFAPCLLGLIYGYVLVKKIFPEFFKVKTFLSKRLTSELLHYALPLMFGGAGLLIIKYVDSIFLTYFAGLNSVAEYKNVAIPTITLLSYLSMAITTVLFPLSSELWEKGEKKVLEKIFEKTILSSLLVITPFSLLLFFFSKPLVLTFFGISYSSVYTSIKILSVSAIFVTLSTIGFSILNGIGLPKAASKVVYLGVLVNLTLNLTLIPWLKTTGAAISMACTYLVMWMCQIRILKSYFNFSNIIKKGILVLLIGFVGLIWLTVTNIILKCELLGFTFGILGYFFIYAISIYKLKPLR